MKKDTVTITLSTIGAGSGYTSTSMNGYLHGVYISIDKAVGANSKVTITSRTTTHVLFVLPDPSTLGGFYYPRHSIHGSTGNVINSTVLREAPPITDLMKCIVATSSGKSGGIVTLNLYVD